MDASVNFRIRDFSSIQVQCRTDQKMEDIFKKLAEKLELDFKDLMNDFEFYYHDTKIMNGSTISNLTGDKNNRSIDIIIKEISKITKCPKCEGNNSIIKIENYLLHFYHCCSNNRNHEEYQLFDNYENTQRIEYKFNCAKCGEIQNKYFQQFYKCLDCSKLIKCSKYYCKKHVNHIKGHKYVKYDEKSFYCLDHRKPFVSYCFKCKKNLCEECEKEKGKEGHLINNHRIRSFNKIISKEKPIKEINDELVIMKEKKN